MSDDRSTAAAAGASEEAVAQLTRLRGPNHPETLVKRAQLARDRAKAGDSQGAIGDYESLLQDLVQVLGRSNTGTLDIGAAPPTNRAKSVGQRDTIVDCERRAQDLLDRVKATYSPLL